MAQKRTKKPKSAVVAEDSPTAEDIVKQNETVHEAVAQVLDEGLFDDAPLVKSPRRELDTPSPDEGLTPAQKLEFVRLVRQKMSLEERADRLATLARMRGSKTAAVGLRAIQHMNDLDGFTDDESTEAPPMFQLPEGTQVAIGVKVAKK